jgi:hypothetical protein
MNRTRALAASLAASLAFAAGAAAAAAAPQTDASRLAGQYAEWAGGQSNADSLVAGLRTGQPITLVTNGADRSVSIAGFTPNAPMSYGAVNHALTNAQRSLSRLGIDRPSAEQIQAALIGGEIATANGSIVPVKGSVAARGGTGPVASRQP